MKKLKRHFLHIFISGDNWHFSIWLCKSRQWRHCWQQCYAATSIDWAEIKQNIPRWRYYLLITIDHRLTLQQQVAAPKETTQSAVEDYVCEQLAISFGQRSEQLIFDYVTLSSFAEQKLWLAAMPRQQQQQLLLHGRALKHKPQRINIDALVVTAALPQFVYQQRTMTTIFVTQQQLWLTLYHNQHIAEIKLYTNEIDHNQIAHQLQQWKALYQTINMQQYIINLESDDKICHQLLTLLTNTSWYQPLRLNHQPWQLENFIAYCAAIGEDL
ncbi:MAG: hypothetical protein P1U34_10545 [Coxiellaceae bacterium]|nr:hypothetical protein [Coxiellaceae bacterium]